MNFNRARRVVRAVSGITIVKRVRLPGLTIPDVTANDWDNELVLTLARCDLSPADGSEILTADGTNIPIVPQYSRLYAVKLNFTILGATSTTNVYRWCLTKNPDGDVVLTGMDDAAAVWNDTGNTPTTREFNKYCLAKGIAVTNPNSAVTRMRVFLSKSAMRRAGPMRPDDTLTFNIAKDTAGTTSILHGFGTLYFRANG